MGFGGYVDLAYFSVRWQKAGMAKKSATSAANFVERTVAIDELVPDPQNPKRHPEKNSAANRASLKKFGQVERLVVQAGSRMIISGNDRLQQLKALGAKEVRIVELNVSDKEARALAVALNRTAELGEWDNMALAHALDEIRDDRELVIGFDETEEARLLESIHASGGEVDLGVDGEGSEGFAEGDLFSKGLDIVISTTADTFNGETLKAELVEFCERHGLTYKVKSRAK